MDVLSVWAMPLTFARLTKSSPQRARCHAPASTWSRPSLIYESQLAPGLVFRSDSPPSTGAVRVAAATEIATANGEVGRMLALLRSRPLPLPQPRLLLERVQHLHPSSDGCRCADDHRCSDGDCDTVYSSSYSWWYYTSERPPHCRQPGVRAAGIFLRPAAQAGPGQIKQHGACTHHSIKPVTRNVYCGDTFDLWGGVHENLN